MHQADPSGKVLAELGDGVLLDYDALDVCALLRSNALHCKQQMRQASHSPVADQESYLGWFIGRLLGLFGKHDRSVCQCPAHQQATQQWNDFWCVQVAGPLPVTAEALPGRRGDQALMTVTNRKVIANTSPK